MADYREQLAALVVILSKRWNMPPDVAVVGETVTDDRTILRLRHLVLVERIPEQKGTDDWRHGRRPCDT